MDENPGFVSVSLERGWVILRSVKFLSSQEPTEEKISKLKLKLYRKKSEMYFSYCTESKDFIHAFSNCSIK